MPNFRDDILRLVKHYTTEEVLHKMPSLATPYPLLFLPSKQIAFHLAPIPNKNIEAENQYLLQNLVLDAKHQDLRFINLFEDFSNIKNSIVSHRIGVLIGVFCRIHARNTIVERIDKKTLDDFLNTIHLYGSPTARYKYGLFDGGKLVAAASFSAGRPIERNGRLFRSFELVRFANLNGCVVTGGVGKLLSHFIKEVKPDDVMSYADLDWSSGSSYEKLGFTLDSVTTPQPFWINPTEKIRYYPHKLPKELVDLAAQQNRSIEEILAEKQYYRFYNSGNLKYLLALKA